LGALSPSQRRALHDALAGFYKMAGVGLVREPTGAGLPQPMNDEGLADEPTPDRLLFERVPVEWEEWVRAWELDQAGKAQEALLAPEACLLPGGAGQTDTAPLSSSAGPDR